MIKDEQSDIDLKIAVQDLEYLLEYKVLNDRLQESLKRVLDEMREIIE